MLDEQRIQSHWRRFEQSEDTKVLARLHETQEWAAGSTLQVLTNPGPDRRFRGLNSWSVYLNSRKSLGLYFRGAFLQTAAQLSRLVSMVTSRGVGCL